LAALQSDFLTIVPRIERHGRVYFRHLRCPDQKEDVIREMIALSWSWFVRLAERDKDATQFPSVLASYAARAVKSGRRLCRQEKAKDALSPRAQTRHSFVVCPLPNRSTLEGNIFDEALRDNTQTEVPDQVAFRLDFPVWRAMYAERDRRLIDDLMAGERTFDLARAYGISPARISQKRREFHRAWQQFHGDCAEHATNHQGGDKDS